jgi:hypothetical protein
MVWRFSSPLIHTSLQRGDEGTYLNESRFNGFLLKTIEMVCVHVNRPPATSLKRGVIKMP